MYDSIVIHVNYHSEPELWTVDAYGYKSEKDDDPTKVGDTEDYRKDAEDAALSSANNLADMFLKFKQTRSVTILENGTEVTTKR